MSKLIINGILVEKDFTFLNYKFQKGDIIEATSKHTLVLTRKEDETTMTQPINLGAYADPRKNDYYDVVRFMFEAKDCISLILLKQLE